MQSRLTNDQLNFMYAQSNKMTAREIGVTIGVKPCAVTVACGKMGVRPLRHSLKLWPKKVGP
jgi:hypothetical protein